MKLFKALALALLLCPFARAQNAALMPVPRIQFFSANGVPLAGGFIYTCVAGLSCTASILGGPPSNPQATYTDSTAGTPNPNPIVLDAGGFAGIWLGSLPYKIVAQDLNGIVQWTVDQVSNGQVLTAPNGATLVSYTAAVTGAATRTVAARLGDSKSVMDFAGANNSGSADNLTAFTAAAAWVNAGNGRTLSFPDGTYNYSGGLAFTSPMRLTGGPGAVLNYTGSANAATMGPAGLTVSTFQDQPYIVEGLTFTGGGSMAEGIYFNEFITQCRVFRTVFFNFGNTAAAHIWFQGQNWDGRVDHITDWTEASGGARNGVWVNAADPANGTAGDNGQSQLHVTNSLIQNLAGGGVGVYLNGAINAIDENTTISGFAPNIRLGGWSSGSVIHRVYMERDAGSAPCIQFGDPSGVRVGAFLDGVTVSDSYCNVHNTDFSTTAHFIGPTTGSGGISNWRVENNRAADYAGSSPLVVQNNLASQVGNYASYNRFDAASVRGNLHSAGGSINTWNGLDGDLFALFNGFTVTGNVPGLTNVIAQLSNGADATGVVNVQCGLTVAETCGWFILDVNNLISGGIEGNGAGAGSRMTLLGPAAIAGAQILSTGQLSVSHGIDADGGGMKVILNAPLGCSTAATIGATCTSSAISLGTTFANNSYSLTCTLTSVTAQPHIVSTAKSAGSFTVTIAADTAVSAAASVDCLAVHN